MSFSCWVCACSRTGGESGRFKWCWSRSFREWSFQTDQIGSLSHGKLDLGGRGRTFFCRESEPCNNLTTPEAVWNIWFWVKLGNLYISSVSDIWTFCCCLQCETASVRDALPHVDFRSIVLRGHSKQLKFNCFNCKDAICNKPWQHKTPYARSYFYHLYWLSIRSVFVATIFKKKTPTISSFRIYVVAFILWAWNQL